MTVFVHIVWLGKTKCTRVLLISAKLMLLRSEGLMRNVSRTPLGYSTTSTQTADLLADTNHEHPSGLKRSALTDEMAAFPKDRRDKRWIQKIRIVQTSDSP